MKFKPSKTCIFISPHLDDAILSCGGYLTHLRKNDHQVIVITVFSEAESNRHSKHTKQYLKHCGLNPTMVSPDMFFQHRKDEDKQALKIIGLKGHYLGFSDLAWRKNKKIKSLFLYPNHKTIFSAQIHQQDELMIKQISRKIKTKLVKYHPQEVTIFAPIGIGNNTDHIIINKLLNNYEKSYQVVYWEDYPYNLNKDLRSKQKIKGYKLVLKYNGHQATKTKMIKKYRSQLIPLFSSSQHIPLVHEKFFIHR